MSTCSRPSNSAIESGLLVDEYDEDGELDETDDDPSDESVDADEGDAEASEDDE